MTTATGAREFVARLLRTEDAARRHALIQNHGLDAEGLREAVLALVAEAERIVGADPPRMERICLDALTLAETAGDEYAIAMAQLRYADARRVQGHFVEAIPLYDRAQEAFIRLGRPIEAARTRNGWIECMAVQGRGTESLAAARAARRIFLEYDEHTLAGSLENTVARVQALLGQKQAALRSLNSAMEYFRAAGEAGRVPLARVHQNRGALLSELGRHHEAIADLEVARRTFEAAGEAGGIARMAANLGLNYLALGRHAAALRALETSREMSQRLGITAREAILVSRAIADCYLALNRPADALDVIDAATQDSTAAPDLTLALTTRKIVALLRIGRRQEALDAIGAVQARQPNMAREHLAWMDTQRASILLADAQLAQALESAHAALIAARSSGNRRALADALIVQGEALLRMERLALATTRARRARRLAEAVDASPLLYRSHELLGKVAEARAATRTAMRHYRLAIDQLEREQTNVIFEFRDSFAAGRQEAFERLASLYLREGRASDALAVVERGKSRALADAVRGGFELRPRGDAEARRLARELARTREQYAAAAARAIALRDSAGADETDTTAVAADLAGYESRIADLLRRLQIAGAADSIADLYAPAAEAALPAIPARTALIEFAYSGSNVLRFVVRGGGVQGTSVSGAVPQVERLVRAFRLNLDAVVRARTAQLQSLVDQAVAVLQRLYALLLDGVDLSGVDALVFVPHGLLHYVPLHALHDGHRYLVERVAVSYAPSAALYGVFQQRRPARRGAVVLAHSSGRRLPRAIEEARAIAELLEAPIYCEQDATRSRLRSDARRAALIHIAAHGEFRGDAPLFSRIELADGPLTTADVFALDLRAGLVTLSACETGRSVLGGGDELSGLVRAFLYAGAAGLLVSQWQVNDDTTAALMEQVYRSLANGAGRASALRDAQVAILNRDMHENRPVHPFYWAGFQVIGENVPVLKPTRRRGGRDDG